MEKYIIIKGEGIFSTKKLEEQVNKEIENGYIPLGGIAIMDMNRNSVFYQTMILNT